MADMAAFKKQVAYFTPRPGRLRELPPFKRPL